MTENLIKYVKTVDFKRGVAVIGAAHFPQVVKGLEEEFEVNGTKVSIDD